MNYATIKPTDVANGPGVRVSLFVSGCTHACKGCFNEEAWDFNYGKLYTNDTCFEIIRYLNHSYISGLSLLGGEPLHPKNRQWVSYLSIYVKKFFPEKNIWCYTGYLFEDLLKEDNSYIKSIFKNIDVLVDGKFEIDKNDITLKFKGSSNQRIIDVQKSLKSGIVILFDI